MAQPDPDAGSQLVVRQATTWERFGASMGSSPIISSFFDNPLFDQIVGETEIAQSCREMRSIDALEQGGAATRVAALTPVVTIKQ